MDGPRILVVTGTGTEVGKTVVTAAVAAAALARGLDVAVLKPAQTGLAPGEPGDADTAARLAAGARAVELARYPEPLAPATAARRAGLAPLTPAAAAAAAEKLAAEHDLVLVEGAGGLLVRYDEDGGDLENGRDLGYGGGGGGTLADAARLLGAPALVVTVAGLGTLNATELTVEALRARGVACPGVVVGSWPARPDLAARCNLADLPTTSGVPLLGAVPEGAGRYAPAAFRAAAPDWLAPALGGRWDAADFRTRWAPKGPVG